MSPIINIVELYILSNCILADPQAKPEDTIPASNTTVDQQELPVEQKCAFVSTNTSLPSPRTSTKFVPDVRTTLDLRSPNKLLRSSDVTSSVDGVNVSLLYA